MRMSRRAGLIGGAPVDPLTALFQDLTVLTYNNNGAVWGINSSSAAQATFTATDYVSSSSTCYMFSVSYGNIGIYKVVNRSTITQLYKQSTSYGGYRSVTTPVSATYGYANAAASSAYDMVRGATMMLVQFPNFSTSDVDSLLGAITGAQLAQRNNSSTGNVRTTNKTHKLALVAYGSYLDIVDGNTYDLIKQCGSSRASTISGSYLQTATTVYGGSIVGLD